MMAGIIGVPLGSFVAQKQRPVMPNCDPLICALGLFISSPMVYFAMILASKSLGWTLFFVFLGMVSLNLTWSLVADMTLVRNKIIKTNFRRMAHAGSYWHLRGFFLEIISIIY